MKRILLILAILALAIPAMSQKLYPVAQVGTAMTHGQASHVGILLAEDVAISTDTLKNYVIFTRLGYMGGKQANDTSLEALYSFVCGSRYFLLGKTKLDFSLGTGMRHELLVGEDQTVPGVKFEVGALAWKSIKFAVGVDYFWKPGSDQTILYGSINLLPLL